ncbi:hypothetical protein SMKC004_25870 [Serratia marcescens]|nr:hypothetical protein SMKC004_25870 [Serratia marcescens]
MSRTRYKNGFTFVATFNLSQDIGDLRKLINVYNLDTNP